MIRPSVVMGADGPVKPRCTVCGKPLGTLDAAVGTHCRTLECRTIAAVRHDRQQPQPRDTDDRDRPSDDESLPDEPAR